MIFISCNNHGKKDDLCVFDQAYNSTIIEFNGFEKNSISKLEIHNLNNEKFNIEAYKKIDSEW